MESWKLIHCGARIVPKQGSVSSLTKWQPPQRGFSKCNINGATFANQRTIAFGMVHRNHRGEFLAARTEHMRGPQEALIVEALCCRAALRWLRNMGVCRVVHKSDSQLLVNEVYGHAKYLSSIGSIIRDCKELFRDIPEVSLVFRRSANRVAHTLA